MEIKKTLTLTAALKAFLGSGSLQNCFSMQTAKAYYVMKLARGVKHIKGCRSSAVIDDGGIPRA